METADCEPQISVKQEGRWAEEEGGWGAMGLQGGWGAMGLQYQDSDWVTLSGLREGKERKKDLKKKKRKKKGKKERYEWCERGINRSPILLLFIHLIEKILYVYECLPADMHVHHVYAWCYGGQKRAPDPLESEL